MKLKTLQHMIKRIYPMIFILLFAVSGVKAQTIIEIPHDDYLPGDILVPVEMLNFSDVGAITLVIEYDSDLLSFVSIENTLITGTWVANYNENEDKLFIQFNSTTGYTINGTLLDIKFSYPGGFMSPVTFDTELCEIADATTMMPITGVTYNDGSVDQLGSDGTVTLVGGTYSIGNNIDIPVNIVGAGFNAVDAITLKIAYDPAKLVYTGKTDDAIGNGTGIVTASASDGMLTITWFGPAQEFITQATLLDLHFNYHGGTADLAFYPGSEISSNYAAHPVTYVNGLVEPANELISLTIGQVGTIPGDPVSVPISADGFAGSLVGAITLNVQYDNSLLVYTGFTPNQLPGSIYWTVLGIADGTITIAYSNQNNIDLIADGDLITLHFMTDELDGGGVAPVVFLPGNEVTSTVLVDIPVSYYDGSVSVTTGYSVSGYLKYANVAETPLNNSTVELRNDDGTVLIAYTTTDADGYYEFLDVPDGDYMLTASTTIPWGGVDIDDAIYIVNAPALTFIPGTLLFKAADLEPNGIVDINDAIWISQRVADPINYPKPSAWTTPDWVFETPEISVSGGNVLINIYGLSSGDTNSSYVPPASP